MAKEENIIVAMELGSSKLTAIAGCKQPDGAIKVLAYTQEPSGQFIRKGRINNFKKMATSVANIKKVLEDKLQRTISGAYVGIGGMGMHTVANTIVSQLGGKVLITPDTVKNVEDSNICNPGSDKEILDVVTQDYKLGTQIVADPVGIEAECIEGRFLNIIASADVTNDGGCFREAGIKVVAKPISVLALANAILAEPEKRSGCVFVDMGAETTSVAVYKNNILRHLAVVPLGGNSINRDLCNTLQIDENEAEELKCRYGCAAHNVEAENHAPISLKDGRVVAYEEFNGLIEARMEEIILNINNQVALSHYDKSQLIAGVVVTGGAANIEGIAKAFSEFTDFEKVRFVKNISLQYRLDGRNSAGFNTDGSYNTAIAIVDKGEKNCCGGELGQQSDVGLFGDEEEETPDKKGGASQLTDENVTENKDLKSDDEETGERTEDKPKSSKTGSFFRTFKRWAEGLVSDEDKLPKDDTKDAN